MRAEAHLVLVHSEASGAAAKLEQLSHGSRSRWYCATASATVCLVRLFFSSNVATGSPFMKSAILSARCASARLYRRWRVTLKRLHAYCSAAFSSPCDGVP